MLRVEKNQRSLGPDILTTFGVKGSTWSRESRTVRTRTLVPCSINILKKIDLQICERDPLKQFQICFSQCSLALSNLCCPWCLCRYPSSRALWLGGELGTFRHSWWQDAGLFAHRIAGHWWILSLECSDVRPMPADSISLCSFARSTPSARDLIHLSLCQWCSIVPGGALWNIQAGIPGCFVRPNAERSAL